MRRDRVRADLYLYCPGQGTAPGTNYFLCYWIDAPLLVAEGGSAENNNAACWNSITVLPLALPDLVSTSASISRLSGFPGESIVVSLDVKNQGTTNSVASKVNFYFHRDSSDFTSGSLVGRVALPALAAGATASGLTFTYTIPSGTAPGTNYFLCYLIDGPGLVTEGDAENNNAACWNAINVLNPVLPDLLSFDEQHQSQPGLCRQRHHDDGGCDEPGRGGFRRHHDSFLRAQRFG